MCDTQKIYVIIFFQLSLELSEACLPDIDDIFSVDSLILSNPAIVRFTRRSQRRLNQYLTYILHHPIYFCHELLWEFILLPELPYDRLRARTLSIISSDRASLLDQYPSYVDSIDDSTNLFHQAELTLKNIKHAVQQVTSAAKRLSKSQRDFASSVRLVQFCFTRPTGVAVFSAANVAGVAGAAAAAAARVSSGTGVETEVELDILDRKRKYVGEALRNVGDVVVKQSALDYKEMGDALSEAVYEINGAMKIFPRFTAAANELTRASNDCTTLSNAVSRLETTAKSLGTEESVQRLSEVFFQYSEASKLVEVKSCKFNRIDTNMKQELSHFHVHHGYVIQESLNNFAKENIFLEKSLLAALESSLLSVNL